MEKNLYISTLIHGGSEADRLKKLEESASGIVFARTRLDCRDKKDIDSVREVQKKLHLNSGIQGSVLEIIEMQNLTENNQSVLLKLIEEPPPNLHIYITVNSADNVLPTIASRCHLIDLGVGGNDLEAINDFFAQEIEIQVENSDQISFDQIIFYLSDKLESVKKEGIINILEAIFEIKKKEKQVSLNKKLSKESVLFKIHDLFSS